MPDKDIGGIIARLRLDAREFTATISQARDSMGGLSNASASANKAFAGLAVATAAYGAALAGVVKVAGDFEQGMANVASVTGSTTQDLGDLREIAIAAGESTVFSATEAAGAMYNLASAGLQAADDFRNTLKPALELAAATQFDIARTTGLVVSTLKALGLEMDQASRVTNVFGAAIAGSMTTIEKLETAMKFAGPTAGILGITIEDTAAVMGQLADKGLDASQMGTVFRNSMLRLAAPTKQARTILDKYQVSMEDVTKLLPTPIKLFKLLRDANISAADAGRLFGQRNLAMFGIIRDGTETLEKFRDGITGTTKAQDMAARQLDTFNSSMRLLKSATESLFIAVGTELLPVFRGMVEGFTSATKAAVAWVKENKVLVSFLILEAGKWLALATAVAGGVAFALKVILIAPKVAAAVRLMTLGSPWVALAAAVAIATDRALAYQMAQANARSQAAGLAAQYSTIARSHEDTAAAINAELKTTEDLFRINFILSTRGYPERVKSLKEAAEFTRKLTLRAEGARKADKELTDEQRRQAKERSQVAAKESADKAKEIQELAQVAEHEQGLSEEALLASAKGFSDVELTQFQERKERMLGLVGENKLTWGEYYIWLDQEGKKFHDADAEQWRNTRDFLDGVFAGVQSGWSAAFEGMMRGTKTGTDVIHAMWQALKDSVIKAIADMLAKWLAAQAKMAALNFITGGLGSLFGGLFAKGGVVGAAKGLVPPGEDMLVGVREGEGILRQEAVAGMGGPGAVEALNANAGRGAPIGGGDTIIIQVSNPSGHISQEEIDRTVAAIQQAKLTRPGAIG